MNVSKSLFFTALVMTAIVIGCGELAIDQSDEKADNEEAASQTPAIEDANETEVGDHKTIITDGSSLKFAIGEVITSFERGSSQCCGGVKIGSNFRSLNVRIRQKITDLPGEDVQSDIYQLRIEFYGKPENDKAYPVAWREAGNEEEGIVFVQAISKEDSKEDWAAQGATIEGTVSFSGIDSIKADMTAAEIAVDFDLTFSTGTLSGVVDGPANDMVAVCDKECVSTTDCEPSKEAYKSFIDGLGQACSAKSDCLLAQTNPLMCDMRSVNKAAFQGAASEIDELNDAVMDTCKPSGLPGCGGGDFDCVNSVCSLVEE